MASLGTCGSLVFGRLSRLRFKDLFQRHRTGKRCAPPVAQKMYEVQG
jgi:hypothetical protein